MTATTDKRIQPKTKDRVSDLESMVAELKHRTAALERQARAQRGPRRRGGDAYRGLLQVRPSTAYEETARDVWRRNKITPSGYYLREIGCDHAYGPIVATFQRAVPVPMFGDEGFPYWPSEPDEIRMQIAPRDLERLRPYLGRVIDMQRREHTTYLLSEGTVITHFPAY